MTSTSFNIGVGSESRNSSRVLRPPGGGHSDILGVKGEVPVGRRENNRRNVSSILEGTNQETPTDILEKAKNIQNGTSENGTVQASTKEKVEAKVSPKEQTEPPRVEAQEQSAAKRGRVPPGGFSSGLW